MKTTAVCFVDNWRLGYSSRREESPAAWYPARVPGSVQQDYAAAMGWPPFYQGVEYARYGFMEGLYWHYCTELTVTAGVTERVFLRFEGIDYQYSIRMAGETLCRGEGMFSPVELDITRYAGRTVLLEVVLDPPPMADASGTRSQARRSCKSAACYGWDWHPRLVTVGLWGAVTLRRCPAFCVTRLEASYRLTDDFGAARISAQIAAAGDGEVRVTLEYGDHIVAEQTVPVQDGTAACVLELAHPRLWYPVGYGEQPLYRLTACPVQNDDGGQSRLIGFRRVRLVMNEGGWGQAGSFPKTRGAAPATLEVNGQRIFAKGSNWVNAAVFPADMTDGLYEALLTAVRDAHMNILRVWGGGFVNRERFYELCDAMGILVWQEFPLACNEYPDDDGYLAVLEQEARSIVRRLRTHPCLALWCGGNELFNSWSGMTDQHHALRLLDGVCYAEDRFTPFIATSPLNGMAHGHYLAYDPATGLESIALFRRSGNTAYTEFGIPGMASETVLHTFMTPEELASYGPDSPTWRAHHAFGAWREDSWSDHVSVRYFYGGWDSLEDLIAKTQTIQAMSYRSCFEEMRRQWPRCSMALNWCLNEPWPTAANNSLLSWPTVKKPSYEAVRLALRPQMASLEIERHLWHGGEMFRGRIWMLNDSAQTMPGGEIRVSVTVAGQETACGTVLFAALSPRTNAECGAVTFPLPTAFDGEFTVTLEVSGHREWSSAYTYLCHAPQTAATQAVPQLNMD